MELHRKGDLSEATVLTELKRREIPVMFPFGDNERYDAVAETTHGTLVRLQIKTGRLRDVTVRFDGTSSHTNARGNVEKPYDGDTDVFLVYCHELDQLYLVLEETVVTRMRLRVNPPKVNDPKINPAERYRFDNQWPSGEEQNHSEGTTTASRSEHIATTDRIIEHFRELRIPCDRPVDNSSTHDFLAIASEVTLLLIVATHGEFIDGRVRVNLSETNDRDTGSNELYAVYCADTDEVYLVPTTDVAVRMNLWIDRPDRIDQATRFADEYELARVWSPTSGRPLSKRTATGAAVAAFQRNGSTVGRVADQDCPFELLVDTDSEIFRVSVVTRWLYRGCLRLKPNSCEEVDWFVVSVRDNDTCYVVAADAFDRSISLRVEAPDKSDPSITWGKRI